MQCRVPMTKVSHHHVEDRQQLSLLLGIHQPDVERADLPSRRQCAMYSVERTRALPPQCVSDCPLSRLCYTHERDLLAIQCPTREVRYLAPHRERCQQSSFGRHAELDLTSWYLFVTVLPSLKPICSSMSPLTRPIARFSRFFSAEHSHDLAPSRYQITQLTLLFGEKRSRLRFHRLCEPGQHQRVRCLSSVYRASEVSRRRGLVNRFARRGSISDRRSRRGRFGDSHTSPEQNSHRQGRGHIDDLGYLSYTVIVVGASLSPSLANSDSCVPATVRALWKPWA